ncbi:2-succinyl-6-hydroxy-2,4-cyclohexadiene-1-carboxylate synthase [Bacillus sp. FJAT-47783]|uniref:2-succinyl-6-hydroxy-2, 4-cyclohexadiene-1-carboxylate synthase n=1 Tax=Bacillus sp. FJAT-47783 TaxID=2922712 RepID=UPI001FAE6DF6|nr:2-succinyl-6-hydroxy-2,4-cyclohexadiene-1-carboxylate synthase [Bacillus sp. FJAT-47783]
MKMSVRGVNYFVEICGEGEPIVLLHGFTGDCSTWDEIQKDLAHYQLIKVDILGHGQTDSPIEESRYQMEEVVEDLRNLLEQLQIHQAHFLGYSMGGRLALSFAAIYPNMVSSLILESSSPGLKLEQEKIDRRKSDERLASFILNNGMKAFVDYWERIPLFQSQSSLTNETRTQIRKQRLQNNPIGLANSLRGMGTGSQPSWWHKLHELKVPVLIICGEKDMKFCRIAQDMDDRLLNSRVHIVLNAGHAVHVEQSRIFGKIVSEFIQRFSTNNKGKRLQ